MTPLSDRITSLVRGGDDADVLAFHEAFRLSHVGLRVDGLPPRGAGPRRVDASGTRLPVHVAGNGARVVRVCADPEVFAQRVDPTLNAVMSGEAVLEMVQKMGAEVEGVLVASAASQHSVLIPRGAIGGILRRPSSPKRPWWKR
ncbi:MAG: hypothetical protein SangKO_002620 [Sandaracinaceae bacterium]